MTEQEIYQIAKAWIDKGHENSSVDWVKLNGRKRFYRNE